MILPADNYARAAGLIAQDVNGTATTTFSPVWPQSQRKVVLVASITDPFGGYDVAKVWVQIIGPSGFLAVNNASMTLYSGTPASYTSVFHYTYSYNSSQSEGNYTVLSAVVDNNGQIQFGTTGSYSPFIEYGTTLFSIGVQSSAVAPPIWATLDYYLAALAVGIIIASGIYLRKQRRHEAPRP